MIRAIRTLPMLLLALTVGAFQACACVHDLHDAALGAAHAGHGAHGAQVGASVSSHHGGHAGHATAESAEAHEVACGTSAPECDHAPDSAAVVAKASADTGSKLAHPSAQPALAAAPLAQREARDAVGQTGPPPRAQDPHRSTPVSLKVRLLN